MIEVITHTQDGRSLIVEDDRTPPWVTLTEIQLPKGKFIVTLTRAEIAELARRFPVEEKA